MRLNNVSLALGGLQTSCKQDLVSIVPVYFEKRSTIKRAEVLGQMAGELVDN